MNLIFAGYDPIFLISAVTLMILASYTALDLIMTYRSSDRKFYLFLGATFNLAIGIWSMHIMSMLGIGTVDMVHFNIPIIIFSLAIGICFTGFAFFLLSGSQLKAVNLFLASIFMTCTLVSVHIMDGIQVQSEYDWMVFVVAILFIVFCFYIAFWFLGYSGKLSSLNQVWLKPAVTLMITGAVVEGHFLLLKASNFLEHHPYSAGSFQQDLYIYVISFASLMILGGFIASSTLNNRKLVNTNTDLKDIKKALDESSIVIITDSNGIITYVNDKFVEISKYNREELLGSKHDLIYESCHSKTFCNEIRASIERGSIWKGEICSKSKEGSLFWIDATIVPFLNHKGKPYQYLFICNDITERKKAEEIVHRQDKLAAVGQLAAGVAHEIRNPLTSMRGYAEFLLEDERDVQRKEIIGIILEEISRVNTIVEDFMGFSKPQAVVVEEKNIIPIIQDVLLLLEFEARKKKVSMNFEAEEEIIQIECDDNKLKQVFLNLIKNGIEAMPNGGELTVKTSVEGSQVHISIRDTGVGIPKEKLNKIWEPFYTTKENGNGLGLMVSFNIIESHHGKVYIESEINKGTTFNIFLPAKSA